MSSVNRVSEVRVRELKPQLSEQQLQRRIELHTSDSMETVRSIRTDGGQIALPTIDPSQQQAIHSLFAGATTEQRRELALASHNLYNALGSATAADLENSASGLQAPISHAMEVYIETSQEQTIEQVTTGTMHMALAGAQGDVYGLAVELQDTLGRSNAVRESLADFRTTLSDWPEGVETQYFEWYEMGENGELIEKSGELTKAQAEAKMENMEEALSMIKDVRQDFQLRLQDAMQKQQQIFQMLSGIMKSFHDTAKAIIGNLRG